MNNKEDGAHIFRISEFKEHILHTILLVRSFLLSE